jgi:hypothetical protein
MTWWRRRAISIAARTPRRVVAPAATESLVTQAGGVDDQKDDTMMR